MYVANSDNELYDVVYLIIIKPDKLFLKHYKSLLLKFNDSLYFRQSHLILAVKLKFSLSNIKSEISDSWL